MINVMRIFVGLFVVSEQMMPDSVMVENCTDVLRVEDELNGPKYRTLWHSHMEILSPLRQTETTTAQNRRHQTAA